MAQLAHDCSARLCAGRTGRLAPVRAVRTGQPTFEPVISLLGTGWPFFIALNMRSAWV
jgi:hypothetical protein